MYDPDLAGKEASDTLLQPCWYATSLRLDLHVVMSPHCHPQAWGDSGPDARVLSACQHAAYATQGFEHVSCLSLWTCVHELTVPCLGPTAM